MFVAADRDGGLAAGRPRAAGHGRRGGRGSPTRPPRRSSGRSPATPTPASRATPRGSPWPSRTRRFRRQAGSVGGGWLARAERLLESRARVAVARPTRRLPCARGADGGPASTEGIELADRAMELARSTTTPTPAVHGDELQGHGARSSRATGRPASRSSTRRPRPRRRASSTSGSRATSTATRSPPAATSATSSGRRSGPTRASAGCAASRWAATRASAGSIGRSSRCSAATGPRRSRRRARPARSSSASGSSMRSATPSTRSARSGCGWATSTRPAEAFDRAYEYGHDAQPGLALLQLARGEVDEAGALDRARARRDDGRRWRRRPGDPGAPAAGPGRHRARGRRPGGGRPGGRRARVDRHRLRAAAVPGRRADRARRAAPRRGRPSEASPVLGQSWRLWQTTDLPYESARARLRYAEALAAEGDPAAARRDLRAARTAFERLGATLDLQRVDALLGEGARHRRPVPTRRVTRTFMFTDIVTSTDLVGLIGDEAWGELLRWHDRELRSAFAQAPRRGGRAHRRRLLRRLRAGRRRDRVRGRHPAPAGAPPPRARVRAVGPDRAPHGRGDARGRQLPGPRRARRRARRRGRGEARRSSSRARRWATMGSIRFGLSDPRPLTLKGVEEPVEVRSVDWR